MSQIYLGDKLIASTEGSDIKYDENTSVNEKIDELNSNLNEQNKNLNMRYNAETDTVEIFYNGVWQEWTSAGLHQFLIYNYGEEIIPLLYYSTYTKNNSNIVVANEVSNGSGGTIVTNTKVDVKRYNTLHVKGTFSTLSHSGSNIRVGVVNNNNMSDAASDFVGNYFEKSGSGYSSSEIEVDVSNLTGEYYLRVSAYRAKCIVEKIWLT